MSRKSRISLKVANAQESRIIIDEVGADHLLGHGDMLVKANGMITPERVQGAFVSEKEIKSIVQFIIDNNKDNNKIRIPDLKIVITGTQYGYRRDDGVFVIPIGCLKD